MIWGDTGLGHFHPSEITDVSYSNTKCSTRIRKKICEKYNGKNSFVFTEDADSLSSEEDVVFMFQQGVCWQTVLIKYYSALYETY